MDHSKLWKIQEIGIPDHLTCLLRNLYASQEATVRTGHGTTGWFQIEKGVHQGCILSPCLFNLYAGYILQNAGLDEAQAGIKIARRNINSLRYADDTTVMTESEEELKSFLTKEESEKFGLKLNIQKTEIMASGSISSVQSFSRVRLFVTSWTAAHQARPWNAPGKSTGVGCHFLLQGIFLTQGSNPGLPHFRWTFYQLSLQGSQYKQSKHQVSP